MPMNMSMYLIRSLFDCLSLIRGSLYWTQQNKRKLYFYSSSILAPIVIISTVSVVGRYCKSQCFVSLNFLSLSHTISGENSTTVSENFQGYIYFSFLSLLIIPVFALAFLYLYNRARTNHRIVELISMKSLSSVS